MRKELRTRVLCSQGVYILVGQRNSDHKPITKQTRSFQLVKSSIKKTKLARLGANLRQGIIKGNFTFQTKAM